MLQMLGSFTFAWCGLQAADWVCENSALEYKWTHVWAKVPTGGALDAAFWSRTAQHMVAKKEDALRSVPAVEFGDVGYRLTPEWCFNRASGRGNPAVQFIADALSIHTSQVTLALVVSLLSVGVMFVADFVADLERTPPAVDAAIRDVCDEDCAAWTPFFTVLLSQRTESCRGWE